MTNRTASHPDLLDALDLSELEPEEQEELLLDIGDLIFKGTLVRLIERMDDRTRDAFNRLLADNASEDVIQNFIQTHVPDADSAVGETIAELRDDILAVTKSSK
jgi:hypothetical protein